MVSFFAFFSDSSMFFSNSIIAGLFSDTVALSGVMCTMGVSSISLLAILGWKLVSVTVSMENFWLTSLDRYTRQLELCATHVIFLGYGFHHN